MKKLLIVLLLSIFVIPSAFALEIKSNNAVLYNLNDNKILIDKNKNEQASIASLTKLMTALVAIEKIEDLDNKVSFVKSDYENLKKLDASESSMDKNKQYSYKDLLYGLIMESGADCANALARLTYENDYNFVKAMNEKAKQLGLKNTHFANPIGLDDKDNYSTVDEVATILKKCLEHKDLKTIILSKSYTLSDGTEIKHTIDWYAKEMKIDLSYIKGGKTGFETDSGYALASIAEKDDVTLLLVTTNGKNKFNHIEDAKNIYSYYFDNYSYQTILHSGETVTTINGKYLSKDKINIYQKEDIKAYVENNYKEEDVKILYKGLDTLTIKNKKDEKIGTIEVYYKNELIKTEDAILNQKLHPDFRLIAAATLSYILMGTFTATVIKRKKAYLN